MRCAQRPPDYAHASLRSGEWHGAVPPYPDQTNGSLGFDDLVTEAVRGAANPRFRLRCRPFEIRFCDANPVVTACGHRRWIVRRYDAFRPPGRQFYRRVQAMACPEAMAWSGCRTDGARRAFPACESSAIACWHLRNGLCGGDGLLGTHPWLIQRRTNRVAVASTWTVAFYLSAQAPVNDCGNYKGVSGGVHHR